MSFIIQGVIFDMDGVLVDSEPYIAEAAVRMFAEHGVTVDAEEFKAFTGMGEDRFLGGVAKIYGFEIDIPRDKARTYQIYLELIRGHLGPLAGVIDFVAKCRDRNLRLAIASSADWVKVEGNLHQIGLAPSLFDAVVCGNDVERKKPSPDIFLLAARRLELDPKQCLIIEDAVAGVEAAKAAGGRCLGLTTTFSREQLSKADWIVPDLSYATDEVLDW